MWHSYHFFCYRKTALLQSIVLSYSFPVERASQTRGSPNSQGSITKPEHYGFGTEKWIPPAESCIEKVPPSPGLRCSPFPVLSASFVLKMAKRVLFGRF